MPDTEQRQRYAFEPFGSLEGVLSGQPIKLMPVGKFYRDNRVLDITPADLQEIERNTAAGLPRFRIPINENHEGRGKVGTVKSVKFMPHGPDGAGLYADDYELTDEGRALVAAKRFDAVSPEVVWSKNGGALYQDPQSGKKFDNVIVGLALTDRPFFGHDHVALFSAEPPAPKRGNGYTKLRETMQAKFAELLALVQDQADEPDTMAQALGVVEKLCDMAYPMPAGYTGHRLLDALEIVSTLIADLEHAPRGDEAGAGSDLASAKDALKGALDKVMALYRAQTETEGFTAAAPEARAAEQTAAEAAPNPGGPMGDNPTPTPAAADQFSISAEEFAAIKAKAEKADLMAAQLDKMATNLRGIERARRHDQLVARCERFMAIPIESSELADKFQALEEKDPELAKWFDGLLETLDKQVAQGELFTQRGSGRRDGSVESFEDVVARELKENFGDDPAKYSAAMEAAGRKHPALMRAYLHGAPVDQAEED